MNNSIINNLVEKTWLNEGEVKTILSVLTESLKINHPDLGCSFDQLVNLEKDLHKTLPLLSRNSFIV